MDPENSQDTRAAQGTTARTRISCPGCGRNDHVPWPAGQPTFRWTCFSCRGTFDLTRRAGH